MRQRVHLEGETFLEPGLELRIGHIVGVAENADRRAAIDLLQTLQNRPQHRLVLRRLAQVIDRQNHDRFHPRFADPLWRDELWKMQVYIEWIVLVQVSQPVAIRGRSGRGLSEGIREQGERAKGGDWKPGLPMVHRARIGFWQRSTTDFGEG